MDPILVHGVLMIIAWLVLLPAGVLVARFFKVTKNQDWPNELDNQFWWNSHRVLNYGGMAAATLGFLVIWQTLGKLQLTGWHGWLGLAALILGWLQVISACFRGTKGGPTEVGADPADCKTWRGDHFDMTPRRRRFEAWHKQVGYLALASAFAASWLGLRGVGAPLWLELLPWLAASVFAVLFWLFTRQGRRIDTYKAIWGPDLAPPSPPDHQKKGEVS